MKATRNGKVRLRSHGCCCRKYIGLVIMMTAKFATPQEVAEYVCRQLEGKVIIHRYDAYSTNSIYLKFDYRVAKSLRISDHPGKNTWLTGITSILPGSTMQSNTPHRGTRGITIRYQL